MSEEIITKESTNFLAMEKIKELVAEIVQKGRSLYNNDPKCYTKHRGVDDNAFMQQHCTKEAIKEMIGERLECYSIRDVLAVVSYSMLHYYIIVVERWVHFLYPNKDEDKLTLQKAYKGELDEKAIREFAEHVLYYCCRINYYALVEKKRIDKENRKKEEEKLLNTGSVGGRTTVQSTSYTSRVTPPANQPGHIVNGVVHHPSCQCRPCCEHRNQQKQAITVGYCGDLYDCY